MPAAAASFTTTLLAGHFPQPMIGFGSNLRFTKQLFNTPSGPCASGRNEQLRGPPPVDPIWRLKELPKMLLDTVKFSILWSAGLKIENIARGTRAVTCWMLTSFSGGMFEPI